MSSLLSPTMEPFDITGPLPTGTTLLEASAGTGKTYAVAALVTRFVAEGLARIEDLLVITFGRAASQELRDRVRAQLSEAEKALADPESVVPGEALIDLLLSGEPAEVVVRHRRLLDALASFDAATIATTHQFCQLVLRSLGVAGDTDGRAELVEDLRDLVAETVDDLYLARFANESSDPPFSRETALALAQAVVADPHATLTPIGKIADNGVRARVEFAHDVLDELDLRKRRACLLSYDDLLSRLRDALDVPDSAAQVRMRQRWKVVLVDEFQDTDPVQWRVLDLAFSGHATMVLIGDPKQAIYGFRGGDVESYLDAATTATSSRTLGTNWRSDQPLVDSLQHLLRGVALGDDRIVVHPVQAKLTGSRLHGAPHPEPLRLRQITDRRLGGTADNNRETVSIGPLREAIAEDLADDVAALLSSGATYDDESGPRELVAGDVAILLPKMSNVGLFQTALRRRGIASVITSGSGVMRSAASDAWLTLLEALEQPNRVARVRAVGLTPFVGHTPAQLAAGGDALSDELADRVRRWIDLFRIRGVAAIHESLLSAGMQQRVLGQERGERLLTDINHLAQTLHRVAHEERLGLPALAAWLRRERHEAEALKERTRRLDTDEAAVQISTVHGSKGLQYPVVYMPLSFNRWRNDSTLTERFHDARGRRCLDVGGRPDKDAAQRAVAEEAAEELRLTYVAMTRAQSQVVVWWGRSRDASRGGVTRLMLGRRPGGQLVPQQVSIDFDDATATTRLQEWATAGALSLETVEQTSAVAPLESDPPPSLAVRTFGRSIDTEWRRTSYSGLIRADEHLVTSAVSEPELTGTNDEDGPDPEILPSAMPREESPLSPMSELPAGAAFGSLVHGVLELADPQAPDLLAEISGHVAEQRDYWGVDVAVEDLAQGLLPMQFTPLGPLAGGLRLIDIGRNDRLCELDFEFPMAGGDHPAVARSAPVRLAAVADILERHLPDDDILRPYAEQLRAPGLGDQVLRGYLGGSIDVVLRVPDHAGSDGGHRYVVVDYKTNRLGDRDMPLTAWDYRRQAMADAMMHSHYPLQALLYSVVVHRFLRWRLSDYQPEHHLGGVLYLFVRGMCGPETPSYDGDPAGAFSWQPPAALILELSDLLDGRVSP